MSGMYKIALAPTGSTGNNNHAEVAPSGVGSKIGVEFIVEAVGATPTVTFKLQGTMSDTVPPAATDWQDIILLPPGSETAVASQVVTAVGGYVQFIAQSHIRFFKKLRLVTSANTNVTYRANLVHGQ